MTDKTLDVLIAARRLIEREEDWCPKGWGKNGQRCAIHALYDANGGMWCDDIRRLIENTVGMYLGAFNESHSHAEVLAAFDRVIEAERNKQTGGAPL